MAGPVTSFPLPESPVTLFFGADLGAAIFYSVAQYFSSNASFAYGFQAGTNIFVDPNFGIRLSARLLGTAPTSSDIILADGVIPGGYYYTQSGTCQFGFNVGLIIGLGQPFLTYQKAQKVYRHPPPPT